MLKECLNSRCVCLKYVCVVIRGVCETSDRTRSNDGGIVEYRRGIRLNSVLNSNTPLIFRILDTNSIEFSQLQEHTIYTIHCLFIYIRIPLKSLRPFFNNSVVCNELPTIKMYLN